MASRQEVIVLRGVWYRMVNAEVSISNNLTIGTCINYREGESNQIRVSVQTNLAIDSEET